MSAKGKSGHPGALNHCPLLGVKRTLVGDAAMSAFDAVDGACSAGSKCCRLAESTRAIQEGETATTVAFEVEGIGEDRRGNADKVDRGSGQPAWVNASLNA